MSDIQAKIFPLGEKTKWLKIKRKREADIKNYPNIEFNLLGVHVKECIMKDQISHSVLVFDNYISTA